MAIPKNIQFDMYKYSISDISLKSDGWASPIEIKAEKISSVAISSKYDAAIAFKISLDCIVPYDDYYNILAATKSLCASLSIYIANVGKANKTITGTNKESFSTEWVSVELKAVDQGYIYSRDVVENQLDISGKDDAKKGMDMRLRLYLYDAKKLICYRKNESYIINGNKNDVLFAFLSNRGFDNIIISNSIDSEKQDYAIPYGDLGENLKDFNTIYGIYDNPYLFFVDLNRIYLIDKGNLGNDTEYGELGSVNVYVEPYDKESYSIYAGCYKDDIDKVYILATCDAKIDNIDTLLDYAAGGKIISAVAGTKEVYTDKIGNENIENSMLLSNRKQHTQNLFKLKESKRVLVVGFANIDLGIITPNKIYNVIANAKYYDSDYDISGKYRLSSSDIMLNNDGNGSFVAAASLSLLKFG